MTIRTFPAHPSHDFTGIDWRCMECDCRPGGLWSPLPCGTTEADLAAVRDAEGNPVDRYEASDILAAALGVEVAVDLSKFEWANCDVCGSDVYDEVDPFVEVRLPRPSDPTDIVCVMAGHSSELGGHSTTGNCRTPEAWA